MESRTNRIEIFVCRDIYGVLGIFVFGSLVTQLLTDTSKYTIGEYTYHLRNMKIIFLLSIRSTQTTFPHCLSTQCHFDQHRGFFLSLDKFANLVKPRSVASLELPPMSWTMIVWARRGLRRPRERLVVIFFKIKQLFFIGGDSLICLLALSSICRRCMANQLKNCLLFFCTKSKPCAEQMPF